MLLTGAGAAQAQMHYPLTPAIVENFVASYTELLTAADELSSEYSLPAAEGDSPMAAFGAYMAHQGAMARLTGIATSHGFSGFPEWMQVANSVATAYAFSREGGALGSQTSEAAEQIRNNPSLTQAQKDAMLAQLDAASARFDAMRPPQENLDAVAAYGDEIEALFSD